MVIADFYIDAQNLSAALLLHSPWGAFAQADGILSRLQVGHVCQSGVKEKDVCHRHNIQVIIGAVQNSKGCPVVLVVEGKSAEIVDWGYPTVDELLEAWSNVEFENIGELR